MKKLLILINGLIISSVAFSPTLFQYWNKEVTTVKENRISGFLSVDVVDLTNLKNTNILVPKLDKLLSDHAGKGEKIAGAAVKFTNPMGNSFEYVVPRNDRAIKNLEYILSADTGFKFVGTTRLNVRTRWDGATEIQAGFLDGNVFPWKGIGNWQWPDDETFDKFLTKDVVFEYKFYTYD